MLSFSFRLSSCSFVHLFIWFSYVIANACDKCSAQPVSRAEPPGGRALSFELEIEIKWGHRTGRARMALEERVYRLPPTARCSTTAVDGQRESADDVVILGERRAGGKRQKRTHRLDAQVRLRQQDSKICEYLFTK